MLSFSPSRLLPLCKGRLLHDGLHLDEFQGPPLGFNPRRPARNHEMQRFIFESMHVEVDHAWRHQGSLQFTAFILRPIQSSEA
jgi:hypothetical protein